MTNQSVITEERFSKGKTFTQYMESGIRNYDQFKENYENLALSPKQEAALGDLKNHLLVSVRSGARVSMP